MKKLFPFLLFATLVQLQAQTPQEINQRIKTFLNTKINNNPKLEDVDQGFHFVRALIEFKKNKKIKVKEVKTPYKELSAVLKKELNGYSPYTSTDNNTPPAEMHLFLSLEKNDLYNECYQSNETQKCIDSKTKDYIAKTLLKENYNTKNDSLKEFNFLIKPQKGKFKALISNAYPFIFEKRLNNIIKQLPAIDSLKINQDSLYVKFNPKRDYKRSDDDMYKICAHNYNVYKCIDSLSKDYVIKSLVKDGLHPFDAKNERYDLTILNNFLVPLTKPKTRDYYTLDHIRNLPKVKETDLISPLLTNEMRVDPIFTTDPETGYTLYDNPAYFSGASLTGYDIYATIKLLKRIISQKFNKHLIEGKKIKFDASIKIDIKGAISLVEEPDLTTPQLNELNRILSKIQCLYPAISNVNFDRVANEYIESTYVLKDIKIKKSKEDQLNSLIKAAGAKSASK